ncbi:hypothetical protein CK489_06935 [Bradyrhizobium sp. UFLA03-84]|uniref:hypothetical protein n=1 Tax=Bradyrhizobium sp. UFLA03-84 TaxID=418599 RepID=UPI000BAE2044|nr:hypothetical protein [Bradyrhizobium sp. UFLA03-84]PAY10263.1 hypothetical protein CK489_06935 [Bradyrhizobium sp. UFLA03-84]
MSQDRSFAVNRLWATVALAALLIAILIFAFMFLACGAASLGLAMEFPRHVGESAMFFVVAVICGAALLCLCAAFGSLFKTLKAGGPALTISPEGFRYSFASDDLIPWKEIRDISPDGGLGRGKSATGLRFQLDSGFADTLHWRSKIANSFKSQVIAVRFAFIKAPKAELWEALIRPLQSKSVQASSALLAKANWLLG